MNHHIKEIRKGLNTLEEALKPYELTETDPQPDFTPEEEDELEQQMEQSLGHIWQYLMDLEHDLFDPEDPTEWLTHILNRITRNT